MDGLRVKVSVNDIIDIYEKEVSVNTKNKNKVYNFERNKIENIYDIKNIIENNNYKIKRYNIFTINSPKYRIVMSLNMKDKIINHYVARFILLHRLNKYLDMRNCATRKNMGYDYAIKLLKKYIELNKKYDRFYILKIDISKYFYSIDHDVLKELLKDKLNEEEYKIVSSIIDSTNEKYINEVINSVKNNLLIKDKNRSEEINKLPLYEYNKGLPIGNMTSQILSIFYLYKLDHYIIHNLNLKYMVRYMDDYIIISNDKNKLKKALKEIEFILNKEYKLNINKNKTNIYDSYHGFEYIGYMFYIRNNKTIIRIKSSNKRRRNNNIKKTNYLYKNNYISYQKYFNSMSNYNNSYKYTN